MGVAPHKHDVISMQTQQCTHTKHISIERYHPVVYAEIFEPNQNNQWKFVLPQSENRQKKFGELPYFALKCDNFPKGLRKKAECPNESYFLAKKIWNWLRDSTYRFWDTGETAWRIGFRRFAEWPLSPCAPKTSRHFLKKTITYRVKMKSANILQIWNNTPYSYIIWIYKHTIWKSASDTKYKKKWPGPNQVSRVFNNTTATISMGPWTSTVVLLLVQ